MRGPCFCSFYVDAAVTKLMSATIFLARHGTHDEVGRILSGRSDVPLSRVGAGQASRLAALCKQKGVRTIHTSPRPRTRQTAQIIGHALGIETEVVDDLDEIDFGAWAGRSFEALEGDALWRRWNSRRASACPPGGETMVAAARRISGHLDRLASAGRSHVLCVSHCDMIRGAVAAYTGLGFDRMLELEVAPGSLSSLLFDEQGARVLQLNEVPG